MCYIPENNDYGYVRKDFLDLSLGQEEIAEEMFLSCKWQEPETWLDSQFAAGELAICLGCGKIYQSYEQPCCPKCCKRKEKRRIRKVKTFWNCTSQRSVNGLQKNRWRKFETKK